MTALVVLESPDGAGKSTVAALLPSMLAPLTSRVFAHEHPGACDAWAAATCYAAQRAEVASRIARGLEPAALICDRWWMTAAAFAAVHGDEAERALARLESQALPRPALVVVLDAADATLDARRPDASPAERRARAVYRDPAMLARWGAVVVSAEGDAREVAWRVARLVREALAPHPHASERVALPRGRLRAGVGRAVTRLSLVGDVSGPLAVHRAGYSLDAEPRLLRLAARVDGALVGSQRVGDFPALWSRLVARVGGGDVVAEASPLLRAVLAVEAARAGLSLPPWRWAGAAPWLPLPEVPAVAATGHRHITADDAATVERVVGEYPCGVWVFGGAIGVDTVALRAARSASGLSWLRVIVPGTAAQQPAEAQRAIRECADEVVEMRGDLSTRGPGSAYHRRNVAMVADASEVIMFTDGGPSGTRHCAETAREQARPVRVVGIQGSDWRRR